MTTAELGAVFKSLGKSVSETELLDMIKEVDVDGSGELEFEVCIPVHWSPGQRSFVPLIVERKVRRRNRIFFSEGPKVVQNLENFLSKMS